MNTNEYEANEKTIKLRLGVLHAALCNGEAADEAEKSITEPQPRNHLGPTCKRQSHPIL